MGWGLLLAGILSFLALGLGPSDLVPREQGWAVAREFLGRAVSPALAHESRDAIAGRPPILLEALDALWRTVVVASMAMAIAIVAGFGLGFFASTAWWAGDPAGSRSVVGRWVGRLVLPTVYVIARSIIGLLRSIHELFWAILFLVSVGLSEASAVLALALTYTGILGKIYSELLDEAPRQPAHALRDAGAGRLATVVFGLLPQALPDMLAYTFYRFECAIRSSAVLGFFGVTTIGYLIQQSFRSTYYGEVWTYLYVLIATILTFDAWSGAVRRRLQT